MRWRVKPILGAISPTLYVPLLCQQIYAAFLHQHRVFGIKDWHKFQLCALVELGVILLVKLNNTFIPHTVHPVHLHFVQKVGGIYLSYHWRQRQLPSLLAKQNVFISLSLCLLPFFLFICLSETGVSNLSDRALFYFFTFTTARPSLREKALLAVI